VSGCITGELLGVLIVLCMHRVCERLDHQLQLPSMVGLVSVRSWWQKSLNGKTTSTHIVPQTETDAWVHGSVLGSFTCVPSLMSEISIQGCLKAKQCAPLSSSDGSATAEHWWAEHCPPAMSSEMVPGHMCIW
jgi:hypothetical protein